MGQTRSLPFVQGFTVPLSHPALPLSGNSAAVDSFAASGHGEKYGDAGGVTFECTGHTCTTENGYK
jgi:hypothetical protein